MCAWKHFKSIMFSINKKEHQAKKKTLREIWRWNTDHIKQLERKNNDKIRLMDKELNNKRWWIPDKLWGTIIVIMISMSHLETDKCNQLCKSLMHLRCLKMIIQLRQKIRFKRVLKMIMSRLLMRINRSFQCHLLTSLFPHHNSIQLCNRSNQVTKLNLTRN